MSSHLVPTYPALHVASGRNIFNQAATEGSTPGGNSNGGLIFGVSRTLNFGSYSKSTA
jgi:hypothetical protein